MAILRQPPVRAETGHRSDASIYTMIRAGLFTKPVRIGQRSVGWPSEEVQAINFALIAGKSKDELRELVNHREVWREWRIEQSFGWAVIPCVQPTATKDASPGQSGVHEELSRIVHLRAFSPNYRESYKAKRGFE